MEIYIKLATSAHLSETRQGDLAVFGNKVAEFHFRSLAWITKPWQKLETVGIAEPLQNRQHARETPNAVNTRREGEWEGELKARREEEGN